MELDGAFRKKTCINLELKYVTVPTKGHEFVRLQIAKNMSWHSDMVNKIELKYI